jgi:subfamily B ATP-binding cassette protein MsbA
MASGEHASLKKSHREPVPGTDAVEPKKARRRPFDARARSLLRRFLVDWIWPRWRALLSALALTALLAAATGGYPLIIKHSFDTLLDPKGGALPLVVAAIIVLTIARALFLYLQNVATHRLVMRMTADIQKRAFAHLIGGDFGRLTRQAPGHLVSRLTHDVASIQHGAQAALNTSIRDMFSIVTLVGTMFYLDWAMSLIVVGIYPIAALPIATVSQRLRKVARRTQSQLGDMTSLLTEKLSGARLIKTFRLEDYAVGRVNDSFEEIFRLRMKSVQARARLDPMLEVLGGAAVAGVIAFAHWRIARGGSTVGDFMGFATALLMAAQPIRALGGLAGRVQEGLAAAESIYELLDEQPKVVDRPGARALALADGTIAFERVAFSYVEDRRTRAVRDFSLVVPGGKTVALVGRSGAGKSTVINLVPRLFDVVQGRITIDGQDVRDVALASLRGSVSIVSQDVTLFDDTIRANIALGRIGAGEAEIIAAAKAAAAHDFILAQPQAYETPIGDRGMRLSGGQRQRLALARAILKNAPILLLDEPTSALDTESERVVQTALAEFTRTRTTLVIAHRLSTVQNADFIVVMEDGGIVEMGTHSELLARNGAYARLTRSQLVPAVVGEASRAGRVV